MKRISVVTGLAFTCTLIFFGEIPAHAQSPSSVMQSLVSIWTDPSTSGQIQVASYVDDTLTKYRYEVTNLSYNPPGGFLNYGLASLATGSYLYN